MEVIIIYNIHRVVLNSFLLDSSNRKLEENYNLIMNLKFIFYYEISLKISSQVSQSSFYNSISFQKNVIRKFFMEKFNVLSSIFFSDEHIVEKLLKKEDIDIDMCFENYLKQNIKSISNKVIEENSEKYIIHTKTRVEILNIFSFLIDNYQDHEIISNDIKKFVLELFDILLEGKENITLLENIKQICIEILFIPSQINHKKL